MTWVKLIKELFLNIQLDLKTLEWSNINFTAISFNDLHYGADLSGQGHNRLGRKRTSRKKNRKRKVGEMMLKCGRLFNSCVHICHARDKRLKIEDINH